MQAKANAFLILFLDGWQAGQLCFWLGGLLHFSQMEATMLYAGQLRKFSRRRLARRVDFIYLLTKYQRKQATVL